MSALRQKRTLVPVPEKPGIDYKKQVGEPTMTFAMARVGGNRDHAIVILAKINPRTALLFSRRSCATSGIAGLRGLVMLYAGKRSQDDRPNTIRKLQSCRQAVSLADRTAAGRAGRGGLPHAPYRTQDCERGPGFVA